MSDWRVCELEAMGACILDPAMNASDSVEAVLNGWRVRWSWGVAEVAREEEFDRWANSREVQCEAHTREDVAEALRTAQSLRDNVVRRAAVAGVIVSYRSLDGGPVLCRACITAWRPTRRCPSCGGALGAEQDTPLAHAVYAAQRTNDAPAPGSPGWAPWIAARVPHPSDGR